VYFKDLKVGWVVGFQGQLMRSDDGGTTWKAQSPKDAKGEPIRAWLKGIAVDKSNRLWVAADDQLLMSADGQTWSPRPPRTCSSCAISSAWAIRYGHWAARRAETAGPRDGLEIRGHAGGGRVYEGRRQFRDKPSSSQ